MSLELRCTDHPVYTGEQRPGFLVAESDMFPGMVPPESGSGACAGCWELFRQVQARLGNPEARR